MEDVDADANEDLEAAPAGGRGQPRKRKRWRKSVSRWSGYLAGRLLHAVVSRLPYGFAGGASALIGGVGYLFLRRDRRRAIANLTRVLGASRSPAELRALARGVFRHTASVFVEFAILRRWSTEKLRARFPEVATRLQDIRASTRAQGAGGVVGISGHLGNWELLFLFLTRFTPGFAVAVANRIYFPRYQDFLHHLRTSGGGLVFYNDESARKAIQHLREGRVLGFLADHEVRTNASVFVDFLGLPAQTATFPVQLARKLGVPLGLLLLVREGPTYRLIHHGLFQAPSTGDKAADLLEGTRQWSKMLEAEILSRPAQWSWIHDRWRSTPERPRRHLDRGKRIE